VTGPCGGVLLRLMHEIGYLGFAHTPLLLIGLGQLERQTTAAGRANDGWLACLRDAELLALQANQFGGAANSANSGCVILLHKAGNLRRDSRIPFRVGRPVAVWSAC
jgi:hypothetical protein